MSFFNSFSYKNWSFSTLWDWQQGSHVINLTRFLYDLAQNSRDFETNGQQRLKEQGTNTSVYVEKATFLKLREVKLSYILSKELSDYIYAKFVRVSFSGRNLLTITTYSGLDPEVSNFGNQAIARNIDVAPYPPSRSFWFSIDTRF